jgi:hypothetical protein
MGTVESVPAGYTFKYMLSYNGTGLNNAMTGAGDRLLTVRLITCWTAYSTNGGHPFLFCS